ncbi:MAG: hypothetical protein CMJ32_08445 [Phycisphaerae bacterium]|nr:hypothetical protein [Phycisphaerae bacterium]
MRTSATIKAASVTSSHFDTRTAIHDCCDSIESGLGGGGDLCLCFFSFHHIGAARAGLELLRQRLHPGTMLACSARGVLGDANELEHRCGISVLCMKLGGLATCTPFALDAYNHPGPGMIASALGIGTEHALSLILADPFTTSAGASACSMINALGDGIPSRVIGGLASGASRPGINLLVIDDHVQQTGLVGVSLNGKLEVDVLVSQGCRPIGSPLVVTGARSGRIEQISGRPALAVAREMIDQLQPSERSIAAQGLLLGLAVNEYKERFGRGDFLVRNLIGIDQASGSLLINDQVGVGQTIQFHVRDGVSAAEDLDLLLDGQQFQPPPAAVIAASCTGRQAGMFHDDLGDSARLARRLDHAPLTGFHANGEIGPIGTHLAIHGQSVCCALLRESPAEPPLDA